MISKMIATVALASMALISFQPQASAQYFNNNYNNRFGTNINREQAQVRQRIEFARSRGMLNAREYNNLMREFNQIAQIEANARFRGLSPRERSRLVSRLNNLEYRVNREMHDRQYAGRPNIWW